MAKTLYIVDSHSHLYASYFAIPNLTAPDGEPTGATYGFIHAMLKLLRDKKPDYLVAAFDGPAETFRKKAFTEYKMTRKPMPDDLLPQIIRSREILQTLGVKVVEAPGYEADDLVAKFAGEATRDGVQVVIVSRDKDLMQLLGPDVVMYDNRNNMTMDVAWLLAEKGITPAQVIDMLGLMGDAADNIPGVPGIGEKRALGLLQKYGSLDNILAHAAEVPGKMGESLRENAKLATMSRELARLEANIPIDITYQDLTVGEPDRAKLVVLFRQLAFKGLAEQFADAGATGEAASEKKSPVRAHQVNYRCVDTKAELAKLARHLEQAPAFAFDTEVTGLDPLCDKLVGLSVATNEGEAAYVPVLGPEGSQTLDLATVREVLGPAFANAASLKIAHNAKFDLAMLITSGFDVAGPLFDTMIAAYLLDPATREHSLEALTGELLGRPKTSITTLIGEAGRGKVQKTMDQVPVEQVVPYAGGDAESTWRLYEIFKAQLQESGLDKLFHDVEMPLVRVLEQLERTGVAIDEPLLQKLSAKLGGRLEELRAEVFKAVGHEFNLDSPRQLEGVLFDELGLKPVRKTKGGTSRSTDADTLEALAGKNEVAARVLEYRSLAKLKGTYIDALPTMVSPRDGRIHASFNQAVTATGRLSSSDPNLQNIPIRGEQGREIRAAFVPGDPGRDVLLTADYSQIELRLLAHFSQDPFLMNAFHKDHDIHTFVASEIFGVPQAEVTSEQRSRAKTINFSLIYGKTAYGLSRDMNIPVQEAAQFIEAYFARYTRVKEFMIDVLQDAKQNGYVKTILDRRRPTPGVKHTDAKTWNNPERMAFNTVLQGSAADLIKVAMNNIDRRLREQRRPARMILQVHDELVFEVAKEAVDDVQPMIVAEMVGALKDKLSVALKVNVAYGPNWREAK